VASSLDLPMTSTNRCIQLFTGLPATAGSILTLCHTTRGMLVCAYVSILTSRTSTTGPGRSARFARIAGVGGRFSGRSCAPSSGYVASPRRERCTSHNCLPPGDPVNAGSWPREHRPGWTAAGASSRLDCRRSIAPADSQAVVRSDHPCGSSFLIAVPQPPGKGLTPQVAVPARSPSRVSHGAVEAPAIGTGKPW
jgi:hypothetical protein